MVGRVVEAADPVGGFVADEQVSSFVAYDLNWPLELTVPGPIASNLDQVTGELLGIVDGPHPDLGSALRSEEDVDDTARAKCDVSWKISDSPHAQRL